MYKAFDGLSTAIARPIVSSTRLTDARRMKIAANGIQINVRDRGRGQPNLVFLHYWGGSSRTWDDVIDQLADQHRSIALDHRGWGESDAPAQGYGISDLANDAQSVISALELKRYVIVGHSMVARRPNCWPHGGRPAWPDWCWSLHHRRVLTVLPKEQREHSSTPMTHVSRSLTCATTFSRLCR